MRSNKPPTSSSHPIAPYLEAVAPHHRTTFTHHVDQLTHRMRHRHLDRSALEASPLWTHIQANPEQGLSLMWECMATQPPCPIRDVLWAELLTARLPHPHRGWMAAHLWLRLTAEQSAQAHHYVRAVYYFGHRAWDDLNALVDVLHATPPPTLMAGLSPLLKAGWYYRHRPELHHLIALGQQSSEPALQTLALNAHAHLTTPPPEAILTWSHVLSVAHHTSVPPSSASSDPTAAHHNTFQQETDKILPEADSAAEAHVASGAQQPAETAEDDIDAALALSSSLPSPSSLATSAEEPPTLTDLEAVPQPYRSVVEVSTVGSELSQEPIHSEPLTWGGRPVTLELDETGCVHLNFTEESHTPKALPGGAIDPFVQLSEDGELPATRAEIVALQEAVRRQTVAQLRRREVAIDEAPEPPLLSASEHETTSANALVRKLARWAGRKAV